MFEAHEQVFNLSRAHLSLSAIEWRRPPMRTCGEVSHWRALSSDSSTSMALPMSRAQHTTGSDSVGPSLPAALRRWSVAREMPSLGASFSMGREAGLQVI